MRPEDEVEIRAIRGHSPVVLLIYGVPFSDLPTTIVDENGSVLGIFGAVSMGNILRIGAVWMLCSLQALKCRRRFAKESRQWIERMPLHYAALWNASKVL